MDLLPTEQQQQIVDAAASFLANEFPVSQLLSPGRGDAWFTTEDLQQIAGLGWLGIGLPEEFDGVGCTLTEEALLFVELGRHLLPPSLLGSVLGARIAALAGATGELRAILQGDTRVVLGAARTNNPVQIGAEVAGEFLLYEATDSALVLLADEGAAALLPLSALQFDHAARCIDPTLSLACHVALGGPALYSVRAEQDAIFLRGALLVSAMLLGIAEATLERSVTYARERQQFGKPIGSFQSIKHCCAEMSIRCESVRALLYHASITLQQQMAAGPYDVFALKALAIDAAQLNANTAVQIHGGMGYTQEMDIHLFVKRAQVLATLFGSERFHLNRLLAASAPD